MNFEKLIGHFMEGTGLADAWVKSGLFAQKVAKIIMKSKQWNRIFKAHKMTFEALWIIH